MSRETPKLGVRFGVLILPDASWSIARERWQSAEGMGFDHAWTYDHLTWRSLRDGPWFASVPTLTAAAVATLRIRLERSWPRRYFGIRRPSRTNS